MSAIVKTLKEMFKKLLSVLRAKFPKQKLALKATDSRSYEIQNTQTQTTLAEGTIWLCHTDVKIKGYIYVKDYYFQMFQSKCDKQGLNGTFAICEMQTENDFGWDKARDSCLCYEFSNGLWKAFKKHIIEN